MCRKQDRLLTFCFDGLLHIMGWKSEISVVCKFYQGDLSKTIMAALHSPLEKKKKKKKKRKKNGVWSSSRQPVMKKNDNSRFLFFFWVICAELLYTGLCSWTLKDRFMKLNRWNFILYQEDVSQTRLTAHLFFCLYLSDLPRASIRVQAIFPEPYIHEISQMGIPYRENVYRVRISYDNSRFLS